MAAGALNSTKPHKAKITRHSGFRKAETAVAGKRPTGAGAGAIAQSAGGKESNGRRKRGDYR